MEINLQGYDERRFDGPVREDLFCSICQGVLRDPRICENREHPFCLSCISQHLLNSHTCPECRENLTQQTLKDPPRFLMNTLSALKIKCNHAERGCPDYVKLEDLQTHVVQCGFTPVKCGNEECGMEVDKKDKELHERDLCQFRIAKCHDCRDIRARQNEIKEDVDAIKSTQDEIKESQDEFKSAQDTVKEKVDEMDSRQNEMKAAQSDMKLAQSEIKLAQSETKDSVDKMKASQAKMKVELNKLNGHNVEMERKQDDVTDQVKQIKASVDEIKKAQLEIKEDQAMFKDEVSRQLQRMSAMLNQLLQGNSRNSNGAQAICRLPNGNQDVIIIGGRCGVREVDMLNTVEKFNGTERRLPALPSTNIPRVSSASCIYGNDVIVTGGYSDQGAASSIEILKMNQRPLQWMMLDGKLPGRLSRHVVKIYQDLLYIIGGFDSRKKKTYDAIYSLSLNPPFTVQLVARMLEGRRDHRAELLNDKLYILGGAKTLLSEDAIDSVVIYDFIKNEIVLCPSLPKRVCRMATVTWGSMIIIIGGLDENGEVLNDVIMYDTETGQSERLPSLIHKRCGHSAVIVNDVISVMGGWNKEQEVLDSVEKFSMGSDGWKELPGMKQKRCGATAVVIPCE